MLPAELQQPILDRADGNPLYAEEFVRLLKDRDLLVSEGSSWELEEGAEVPFPDSVQALIAARLDTLEPDAKSLLADAAVIGKVFWAGAVAAMGERDPQTVTAHAAGAVAQGARAARPGSRRWRARPSTRSGTSSPATSPTTSSRGPPAPPGMSPPPAGSSRRHPTGSRTWPTCSPTTTPPRSSSPRPPDRQSRPPSCEAPALRFLGLAGERALGLDTAAALASFERALALTPAGHPERAAALARFGEAAHHAGRLAEAGEALEEAITAFRAAGDLARRRPGDGHARHRALNARRSALRGAARRRRWRCWSRCRPAPSSSARSPSSPASRRSRDGTRPASGYAEQALALAEQLGLARPARALGYRGLARCNLGDPGGLEDYARGDHARHRGRAGARGRRAPQQPRA